MLKTITINRDVKNLFYSRNLQLKSDWCESKVRPFSGEWTLFFFQQDVYLGFANAILDRPSYYIVEKISKELVQEYLSKPEAETAQNIVKLKLQNAIDYRLKVLPYGADARLVFGMADFLPGLIIDGYQNLILVQINTAGIDRFRDSIKQQLLENFPDKEVLFLDNEQQRKKEALPQFKKEELSVNLLIQDGPIKMEIAPAYWQKNGYYYDHRDNRQRFYQKLTDLKLNLNNGLDLFCYLGSWGMMALLAGVKKVDFVDQANLGSQLDVNLQKNHLIGRGVFHHGDVFQFLDLKIQEAANYDVIISDPPSFAKSLDKKPQAIQGYKKLHKKILQVLKPGGIVCFASCTHYVTAQEFESTIMDAIISAKRNLKLVDTGIQALDHPFVNFNDKSYYLKYFVYLSE